MDRERLIEIATQIHSHEGCSCDPKYLKSCPNMANAILRAPLYSEFVDWFNSKFPEIMQSLQGADITPTQLGRMHDTLWLTFQAGRDAN